MFRQECSQVLGNLGVKDRAIFVLVGFVAGDLDRCHLSSRPNDPKAFRSFLAAKRIPVGLHVLVLLQPRALVRRRCRVNYRERGLVLFLRPFVEYVEITSLAAGHVEPELVSVFENLLA